MNLNALAGAAVAAVNPWTDALYQASTGSATADSGRRTPTYAPAVTVRVQMQMLSYKDLTQLQGLNLNGEKRAIYVDGDWKGVSRPESRGGDLITTPDGKVWLVAQVLENWHDTAGWTKVAVTLQGNA
jgi:hypothetical protein